MYSDQMHDLAIHRHGDVERAEAVVAVFMLNVKMHIATHCSIACTRTIEKTLQVAALIEQGNGLHFKQ